MSNTSKKSILSLIAGISLIIAYVIYAMGAKAPAAEDIKAWAGVILVFIGIGVGIQIVVQIVFHITLTAEIMIKEEIKTGGENNGKTAERIVAAEMAEDERSRIIDLKASRVGSWFAGAGVIAALISLAVGAEMVIALHILFGMFAFASVAEGLTSIVYHERGVRNG